MTTLADLLLGNPIRLPDGRLWKPRHSTPEQRERDAKKAKAYRKRNKEAIRQRREANPMTPEALERKRETSRRWAERNRELLARRRMKRYYAAKKAQRRATT